MKFTLKDYQDEAVRDVLANLRDAREDWHGRRNRRTAFSLTAATGAGKTVMAAAVFEALFHGDDGFEFDRDPGAVVIWFSDDPSLNEQTRFRLMESSDRLRHTDLKVVEHPFSLSKFEAGKIYFLNTQKLGKKSLLVRGFEGADDLLARPDAQAFTIWDTIRNTIEDPAMTLYLVLDEAHRGMGRENSEHSTIVQRLINGENGVPGIPVVWGISATVGALQQGHRRHAWPRRVEAGAGGRGPRAGFRFAERHHCAGYPRRSWPLRHRAGWSRNQQAARPAPSGRPTPRNRAAMKRCSH